MFSVVYNPIHTSEKLKNNLDRVNLCGVKWKLSFNPDPSKQAQEAIFSGNMNKVYHSPLLFNNSTVQQLDE